MEIEKQREYDRLRHQRNRQNPEYVKKRRERAKVWRAKNPGYHNDYQKRRKSVDYKFRLISNLRTRIYKALKGINKSKTTAQLLGCDISLAAVIIELQFQPGMSWENYGKWHVDHKKPLISFDLSNPTELSQACHISNLQPLWAEDNHHKWGKVGVLLR